MKIYSISLVIKEMHLKTIIRQYLKPVKVATTSKQKINVGEDVEKLYTIVVETV
jgi:hypothetical protein